MPRCRPCAPRWTRAAPDNPVELLGSEGHQAAFNSRALALARNRAGAVVGYSRDTLATDFNELRPYIGTASDGEPNGLLVDAGRAPIDPKHLLYNDLDLTLKVPERMPRRLNSVGITAFLDAMTAPEALPVYDKLLARPRMTVRANLALYLDPEHFRDPRGPGRLRRHHRAGLGNACPIPGQCVRPRRFLQDFRRRRGRG
jgi:predicted amidohydrolase YtcJ